MQQMDITADRLVSSLLALSRTETVCLLDSCGVNHLGSHLLIAGLEPVSVREIKGESVARTLSFCDEAFKAKDLASIVTISYDFGTRLLNISPERSDIWEPDIYLAQFDSLIIHDYGTGITNIAGNADRFNAISQKMCGTHGEFHADGIHPETSFRSNFARDAYLLAIETVKEQIRDGNTYQTNLTQQLTAQLPVGLTAQMIFHRLRRDHPAPFAAFITRPDSTVVSASPERFFRVDGETRRITTSPIKGTRQRGVSAAEDKILRQGLLESEKDRAENTMIVDLLRNDIGRVCEFGTVRVEELCALETHPTLFHLVSTISGKLREEAGFADIIKAVFPCGSITGAPKVSTMRIINEIEPSPRGLSMGAVGYRIPPNRFGMSETLDLSVAIRTMVIRGETVTFNVGGGIVIDSDPVQEYEESLLKAKALLSAFCGRLI